MKSKIKSVLFATLFLVIYVALNYYLSIKINTFVGTFYRNSNKYFFLIIILLLSFLYMAHGILNHRFKINITWMKNLGSFWLAFFYYLVLAFFISDMIFLLFKVLNLQSSNLYKYFNIIYYSGGAVFILIAALIIYGSFNAYKYKTVYYNITINKNISNLDEFKIALIADLHYDSSRIDSFSKIVTQISDENVDLICLCGDIIDENTDREIIDLLLNDLKRLKANYGIYSIHGNHESYMNFQKKYEDDLKSIGIKLLKDEYTLVNNSFYIIGRKDVTQNKVSEKLRMSIDSIVKNVDKSQFILLLDHQPVDVENVEKQNIDLQLSGHTHKGQFFPNNLVTGLMFTKDYGFYKKNNYNLIVTSGLGTWGPPIRIGSIGELVFIKIKTKL